MSRTRDLIQEIADVRARRQFESAMTELPLRLFAIERAFKGHSQDQHELTRYFPVALVAAVEGYFRMAVKDLIDAGEPYLSNAERPAASIKLDFSIIRAVHGKSVTIGELVAHSIPLSRFEHIDSVISGLLGTPFLAKLRTTSNRWAYEVMGGPRVPMLTNPDSVFADVARVFELRHIVCHELASAYEIDYAEVAQCLESCVLFLRASDELISETLHPGAPLTQVEMNIAANRMLQESRAALVEEIEALLPLLRPEDSVTFRESQDLWEQFCKSWSNLMASEVTGGSIWPSVRSGAERETVLKRIDEIRGFRRFYDTA